MHTPKRSAAARLPLALFILALALGWPAAARAQEGEQGRPPAAPAPKRDEVNHELQLYLLAASNGQGERAKLPESLSGVVRQLRAVLPFENYSVAATTFNRVRDGGTAEFRGVGGSPLSATTTSPLAPAFYTYALSTVNLAEGSGGAPFIRLRAIRFGLRVPVQTSAVRAEGATSGPTFPVIQWEDTGLTTTDISVREGEPTVVGTITTARPEELFVLVITARRAGTK